MPVNLCTWPHDIVKASTLARSFVGGVTFEEDTLDTMRSSVPRCARDDEWSDRVGYVGTETHHHVRPTFDVKEPPRE